MANILVPQGKPLANFGDQAPTLGPLIIIVPFNVTAGTVLAPITGYSGQQPPQFHPRDSGISVVSAGNGYWNLVASSTNIKTSLGVLSAPGSNSVEVIVFALATNGLPSNVVTYLGQPVTYLGSYVTYGV